MFLNILFMVKNHDYCMDMGGIVNWTKFWLKNQGNSQGK